MTIATETIGLAGEYAVASELCRRGVYCQLTLGNRKKTDLLVAIDDQRYLRVSVKSKQKQSWPKVKGIWLEDDLLVFVDYKGKEITTPPDFYVLNVQAWKKVIAKKLKNDPRAKVNKENTVFWPAAEEGQKDTWTGCQVSVSEVEEFKDAWPDLTLSIGV